MARKFTCDFCKKEISEVEVSEISISVLRDNKNPLSPNPSKIIGDACPMCADELLDRLDLDMVIKYLQGKSLSPTEILNDFKPEMPNDSNAGIDHAQLLSYMKKELGNRVRIFTDSLKDFLGDAQ